ADWFYEVRWEPRPAPAIGSDRIANGEPGCWLILADRSGVGEALGNALQQRGDRCRLVYHLESGASPNGANEDTVPPAIGADDPAGFQRLFDAIAATTKLPLLGVVQLWTLDAGSVEKPTIRDLETAQALGCGSTIHLLRVLADRTDLGGARLWLVTR